MKNYKLPVGVGDYVYFFEEESEDSDIKYAIKCEKVQEIEINEWVTRFKTNCFPDLDLWVTRFKTNCFPDLDLCDYDNVTEPATYWTNSRKKAQKVADMLNKN